MFDHGDTVIRSFFEKIPDGRYVGKGRMDSNGVTPGEVPFEIGLEISGSDVRIDFSNVPEQQRGPINCPLPSTMGWRIRKLMLLLFEDLKMSISNDQWTLQNETISSAIVDSLLSSFASNGTARLGGDQHQILPHYIKLCVQFAEMNLQSNLTMARFAAVSGRSERSVFDGFKRFTCKTPMQYVRDLRLARARELLHRSDLSVSDVARLVGCRHMSGRKTSTIGWIVSSMCKIRFPERWSRRWCRRLTRQRASASVWLKPVILTHTVWLRRDGPSFPP